MAQESGRTALVAGATGLVGQALLQILLTSPEYSQVKALVRRPLQTENPKLSVIVTDFADLESLRAELAVDDVFVCLGTTIKTAKTQEAFRRVDFELPRNLAKLAKEQGVEKYLLVSAMGANAKSKIFYSRVKGELEAELTRIKLKHLLIFRPSLLLGERTEHRSGEKLAAYLMRGLSFALIGGLRKYRGIEATQVAYAMYRKAIAETDEPVAIYDSDDMARI
ncbi:MAG: hypothetical protein A2201_07290 [Alicyclobacillus sp. RIFOXYA1_FULL_53_8]|nr:MAG: hypothetical protein A2201_07290 [Alicyclobacillus sp. RIFOXYA1_FULL_53_8]